MTDKIQKVNGKRRSLGGYVLTIARQSRELLMVLIVADYLVSNLGQGGVFGASSMHLVETWHIGLAIVAWFVSCMLISESTWQNYIYVRALARRIVRAYRVKTA